MKKLILFELRKVFSKRLSLIVLVGILLFSVLISFSTYQNKYAFDGVSAEGSGKTAVEIDKEIAAKYEGILTDEKVQQMMNDFAPTHDLHGLNAMYLYQNATQSAAFSRFSDKEGNWNGLSVSDVFGNEEIKIGYVDGWLSTSKNMVRVFIALALAVIIMLAPIFSGEYEGVDNIILTSKYGKTKCATAKVAAGILTAILTTALVAAFNLLLALIFYGTEGLDCSILFAPSDYVEGFISFNITCGTLLKYQILLAFTCTLSITGITLFLSAISKNQIVALVAAIAIFLFPVLLPITEANPLFRLVGLLPIYHVLAISLLSVEQKSADKFIALVKKYQNFEKLDTVMLNEFIYKIFVHERDYKGVANSPQTIEIYFNFIGKFGTQEVNQPTEEERAEIAEKERLRKKRHEAYLRRKANGWQDAYYQKHKAAKKAAMDAKKEAIRAEDRAKGVYYLPNQKGESA